MHLFTYLKAFRAYLHPIDFKEKERNEQIIVLFPKVSTCVRIGIL